MDLVELMASLYAWPAKVRFTAAVSQASFMAVEVPWALM